MKSGIASMMAAMIAFKRAGADFNGEILFMGAADEETGSDSGTLHLLGQGVGKKADFAVVSEPTSLRIELGNRGLRWIDITVKGRASHAGRPHLGVNAIAYGAKLIEAIHAMKFSIRNDGFEIPTPSISVTTIDGGAKVNIIPDRCTLAVDRRMMPGETTETVLRELSEVIDPVLALEKDLKIDVRVRPGSWDPYIISRDEPIVRVLSESCREITGRERCWPAKGRAPTPPTSSTGSASRPFSSDRATRSCRTRSMNACPSTPFAGERRSSYRFSGSCWGREIAGPPPARGREGPVRETPPEGGTRDRWR